jgi:hypothetical protein
MSSVFAIDGPLTKQAKRMYRTYLALPAAMVGDAVEDVVGGLVRRKRERIGWLEVSKIRVAKDKKASDVD